MRGGRRSRYTVYDMLDAKGIFDENPANATSPHYQGPVEYPKMYYHPKGKMRVVQKAEILQTPYGPEKVGEQWELIARTVADAQEEAKAKAAGWHDHPAKAIEASGRTAPAMTAHGKIAELERQLLLLQTQLTSARAAPPPPPDEFAIEDPPSGEPSNPNGRRNAA